jgi:succinoglycan biosynthesis transport protein ExoP
VIGMLQFNRLQTATDQTIASREYTAPAEAVTNIFQIVHRQFPVIFLVSFLITALGVIYLLITPPSYTAHATMIIDTKRPQIFQQTSPVGDLTIESSIVSSQVEILKSEKIALAVVNELQLWEDPEFTGPGRGLIGILTGLVNSIVGAETQQTKEGSIRRALDTFQNRLSARRVSITNVLEISFQSYHPDRAIQITNAITAAYIADQLDSRSQSAKQTASWLQSRINELREQATSAERDVIEFKKNNNIVAVAGRSMDDQQLSEVNSQLIVARAQVSEAQARLDRVESIMQSGIPDATVTDTLNSPVINRLRQQYLDLANREADWSMRYGPDHRAVTNLQGQMKEIKNSVSDELRRIAETYKSDYEIAKQREEAVKKSFSLVVSQSQLTNQAQVALRELESRAQTARMLYDNLQQRYMESIQQQSFPISEARLITQASGPLKKSHPQTLLILAGSVSTGMILGFLIGVMGEMWHQVFRTRYEVNARLQTNCIAMVPKIRSLVAKPERLGPRAVQNTFGPRTIVSDQGFFWHVLDSPMSRFAESIRSIKLAIDTSDANRSHKIIALTSALPREGKSTVGTALAQLISHSGAKTILVDCNFRHSTLSHTLTPNAKTGILEVISGAANLEDVIWTEPYTNLTFLPSVANNRLVNSHEILTSDATNALFNKLRSMYEYVIIDLSPLAPIVDARTTTQFIDSYILVVEWGRTRVEDVERALTDAKAIYENLLGVVLNKANLRVLARYDSRHSNYHSDRYYTRHSYSK